MPRFASVLSFTAALLATSAHAAPGRLPTDVRPVAYDITIAPDPAKLSFTGSQVVDVEVVSPTRTVTLNAADLVISNVRLGQMTARVALDAAGQTATFTFPRPLTRGSHKLAMSFTGKINQTATGLFAIDYAKTDGSQARMLATQFEAPDARRFAPMWDEPGYKTIFKLAATAPRGQTPFSNMPVERRTPAANGAVTYQFAASPKMSSYLLFLGMGDVERKTALVGNTEIGVISRRGVIDQGDYALASAVKLLTYFNDYFGTPYPLPKMDMIAGPGSSQFFGAMENWGAIFYFERILLIDPKLATESQKQAIFNVVAHEMAHQWFGNLVTMAWWDDLWLNEGFASWMASKASADLNPEWASLTQSLAGPRQTAFSLDARTTTHPIIQRIETVDQISQAFDGITYRKGEAVIRMLEGAVGPDQFRTGVRSYMRKYAYANTVTDQLWGEISAAAGTDVKPMMDSFTRAGGVPLIRAGEPACANGTTRIALTQDRFGLDAASKARQNWLVPVRVTTGGAATSATVSGTRPTTASVAGCGLAVVNAGQSAYFRTLYAPRHQDALRAGIATLSVDDQVGFTADSYGLANGGYQSIDRYLAVVDALKPDASPIVWSLVAGHMAGLDAVLQGAPEQEAFRTKARKLIAPVFARVGWTPKPNEPAFNPQLRERLIPLLSAFGDTAVQAEAARYAELSFTSPDAVPGAIRLPALAAYSYSADAARWDRLRTLARNEASPVAKQIYYGNLGDVRDPALAQRALDLALTDELPVPLRSDIIASVAGEHPALAFDWAVRNEAAVNAIVDASSRSRFIAGLPGASSDAAVAARLTAYAARALPAGSRKVAEETASTIGYRAGLRALHARAIASWARR